MCFEFWKIKVFSLVISPCRNFSILKCTSCGSRDFHTPLPMQAIIEYQIGRIHFGYVIAEGPVFYLMPNEKCPNYTSVQQIRKILKESLVYWINRAIPYCFL